MKQPHNIAFTILIVVTTGILIGLIEAEIACQVKPSLVNQGDTYPYYGADTLHSKIKLGEDDIR